MLTKKQKRNNWILVIVLAVVSIFFLFPVIWMLANSFKPDAAITADMNSISAFIPPAPNGNFFDNYIDILFNTNFWLFGYDCGWKPPTPPVIMRLSPLLTFGLEVESPNLSIQGIPYPTYFGYCESHMPCVQSA